jgi:putative membrane protein
MSDVTAAAAATVLAHGELRSAEESWWMIATIVALCAVGALYGVGVQDLWQRRGIGAVIAVWRAAAFAVGLSAVALADSPPVREAAAGSFAGHMTQHMLLLVVAGPLLGAGGAALPMSLALPRRLRQWFNRCRTLPAVRWFRRPAHRIIVCGLVFTAVLWLWHLPALFVLAERNAAVHACEHLSFVMVAAVLWTAVLSPDRHRLSGPLAFLLLFAVGMTGAALGAVLTFAPQPLYPAEVYASADALTDQQLAGLVMWIPMDVVLLGLALSVFGRWMSGLDAQHPAGRGRIRSPAVSEVVS